MNNLSLQAGDDRSLDVFIGRRLRLFREQAGLPQKTLGAKLGVTFQQIQKYERGGNRLSAAKLYRAAQILNHPVSDFFPAHAASSSQHLSSCGHSLADNKKLLRALGSFRAIRDPKVRNGIITIICALAENPGDPL
jgi:transcriptional regulator with XRE-family HTH domain